MTASTEVPVGGSPETQAIIDACYQGNWSGIESLVAARREAAEQALDSFLGQADEQGEGFVKAHDKSLQMVESAFDKYQEALESVSKAARSQASDEAKKAATMLAVASFGIRSAVVAMEESYLSYGDSRFPIINLLTNLGERYRACKVPPESWKSTCNRYGSYYAGGVEEIDKSSEKDKPGVSERRATLVRLAELFQQLSGLSTIDPRSKYDDLLFEVSGCLIEMSEAFETYHSHTFLTGETSSPRINLIIKVARGVIEKKYDNSVLRALTTDLSDELQGYLKELDRITKNPQESEILNDAIADMIDVMESIDDGLQSLVALANGEEVEQAELQEALDILIESGDVLTEVNQTVEKYNESRSKVTCPGCGAVHEAGMQTCTSCGSPLPQPLSTGPTSSIEMREGAGESYDEPVMTTVMQELFDKVEEFDRGRLDGDLFMDVLDKFEQRIDVAEQNLNQLHAPEMPEGLDVEQRAVSKEFITIAEDALSLLDIAVAECREGIVHLRHFATTDEKEAKQSGMQLYYDGIQKMWMVARAQKRVEAFIAESADMLGLDDASQRGGGGPTAPTSLSSRFSDQM